MESLKRTKILYSLFVIATILALGIIYTNPKSAIAYNYVSLYLVLVIIFIITIVSKILMKMRNVKACEVKEKIFKFLAVFVCTFTANTIIVYNLSRSLTNIYIGGLLSLGLAIVVSFLDLSIRKKLNEE